MKVLDPFSGYRLASGHPIFHLSLFAGSYVTDHYAKAGSNIDDYDGYLETTFVTLRWAHFWLFMVSILSFLSTLDSEVSDPIEEENMKEKEKKLAEMKERHRDSVWKLFARFIDTLCVFGYQGVIFYVQLEVYNNAMICGTNGCALASPKNVFLLWLYIEIFCFYLYMLSTVFYIAFYQLVEGVCLKKKSDESDMVKAIQDFLKYSSDNLTWFAFNFVLVMMPVLCMYMLNPLGDFLNV